MIADLQVQAATGLVADGRHLANRARDEAENYKDTYRVQIPSKVSNPRRSLLLKLPSLTQVPSSQILADRIGHYCQAYTCYSSVRPFGVSAIIGCVDKSGPAIYMIEPSGVYWGYRGCATGKGRQLAKTEIEKLDLDNMTCEEALKHVALIIHKVHDDAKDKDFELEMSWICPQSKNRHQSVPKDVLQEAEQWAKDQLSEEMEE